MFMNEDDISQALIDVESNPNIKAFIQQFFNATEYKLSKLSNKNILNLEHLTKLVIKYNVFAQDQTESKRSTLS